jgi:hypothetical protein
MIQMNDNDLPVTVAEKLVCGTKPTDLSEAMRNATEKMFGFKLDTQDMFTLEEIKEIADYLMVYYQAHIDGD